MKITDKTDTILIVDDDSMNLRLAQNILKSEFHLAAANSGQAALKYLENHQPSLILMDINMPQMDGFEAVAIIREKPEQSTIPIIFFTADSDPETEQKCFQAGAVDFVGKPFVPDILLSRVRRTLELRRYQTNLEALVEEKTHELMENAKRMEEMQEAVIVGMANLIEGRSGETGLHVKHTQNYIRMIIDKLYADGSFPKLNDPVYRKNIISAAPLHDIGKIRTPDNILLKRGRLTPEEFEIMKRHASDSEEIIREIVGEIQDEAYTRTAVEIAGSHHERWDGTGYPRGLRGEEIPLSARIMAVADVFDALYSERCYKKPVRPLEATFDVMREGRGTHFDPTILDAFFALKPQLLRYLGEESDENNK